MGQKQGKMSLEMETNSSHWDLWMLPRNWDLTLEVDTSCTCFLRHGTQLRVEARDLDDLSV